MTRENSTKSEQQFAAPHIALNAQLLSLSASYRSAGINRYIHNLLLGLARSESPHQFTVFLSEKNFPPAPRLRQQLSRLPTNRPVVRILWEQLIQPSLLARSHADLLHSMAFVSPVRSSCPSVITIYDLSFLRFPERFRAWNRFYLSTFTRMSARRASHFIAISHSTARDVSELLGVPGDRISVIHCGVEESFQPLDRATVDRFKVERGLPDHMILYLGTIEPRKNLGRLLDAYRLLVDRAQKGQEIPPLMIAGARGWMCEDIFAQVESLGLGDRVRFPGFVPTADLPFWYNAADLFVYPSSYEGFGLPVLEAMACGAPVITSNTSSLPEVIGDAGITVSPNDTEELAEAMKRVLSDASLRGAMRQKGLERAAGFSWDKAARDTVAVYDRVLNRGGR